MLNNQEDNADVAGLIGDTPEAIQFRKQMFKSPRLHKAAQHFLPIWDAKGLLDPLH